MASRPGAFDHVADDVGWKSHATHEAFPGVHNLVFLVRVGKTGDSVLRCHAAFSVSYAEGVLSASRFSAARNANYRVMRCQCVTVAAREGVAAGRPSSLGWPSSGCLRRERTNSPSPQKTSNSQPGCAVVIAPPLEGERTIVRARSVTTARSSSSRSLSTTTYAVRRWWRAELVDLFAQCRDLVAGFVEGLQCLNEPQIGVGTLIPARGELDLGARISKLVMGR